MRQILSKPSIAFGSALLCGLVGGRLWAQAPAPQGAQRTWQNSAPAAASEMPRGYQPPAYQAPAYQPPAIPQRLPATAPQQAPWGVPAGGVVPAAAVVPQQVQAARQPRTQAAHETVPPQTLPAQIGAGGQIVLPNGAPLTAEILSGQSPVDMAQSPVIIVMPPGWDPNGVQFAPREISREAPIDYWPMSSRNPLGGRDDRGVFKWPQMARKLDNALEEPRTLAPPTPPADGPPAQVAIFPKREDAPVSKVDEAAKGMFSWWDWSQKGDSQALFPADAPPQTNPQLAGSVPTNSRTAGPSQPERPRSKALFSFWNRKDKDTQPQTPAPQLAHRPQSSSPQAAMQQTVARPLPAAPVSVAPVSTQDISLRQAAAESTAAAARQPDTGEGALKWRAKGAARTVVEEDEHSANRLASHTEPAGLVDEPTPAAPPAAVPSRPATQPEVQPASQVSPPSAGEPAAEPARAEAAAPAADEKALLPKSLFGPDPLKSDQPANPAIDQRAIIPNLLARVGLDRLPMRPPEQPQPQPEPRRYVRTAAPQASYEVYDRPPRVAVNGPPPARATQSYYAPAVEYYVPPDGGRNAARTATKRVTPSASMETAAAASSEYSEQVPAPTPTPAAATCQCQTHGACQCRTMPQQQPHQQRFAGREVPPLVKPFWMLGEMTKLPRFVTGESDEMQSAASSAWQGEECQCARCRQERAASEAAAYRAAQQQATDLQQQHAFNTVQPQTSDGSPVESTADAAAAKPSRRRARATGPATAAAKAAPSMATPARTNATTTTEPVPRETDKPVVVAPPARVDSVPRSARRGAVPSAVAIYSEPSDAVVASDRDARNGGAEQTPRYRTTRIRNSNGTSVLVYNPRDAEPTPSAGTGADRENPLR